MTAASRREGVICWLLAAPAAAYLVAVFLASLALTALYSLGTPDYLGRIRLGLDLTNYATSLAGENLRIAGRSVGLAALVASLSVGVGAVVASYLRSLPPAARVALAVAFAAPLWLNVLVKNYALLLLLGQNGLLTRALEQWSPALAERLLFSNFAVGLGLLYTYAPYGILPVFVALSRVDDSIYEAARLLGSGGWRIFWSIELPLARPGMLIGWILTFLMALGAYVTPDILGGGKNPMVANLVYLYAVELRMLPVAAAMALLVVAATAAVGVVLGRRA